MNHLIIGPSNLDASCVFYTKFFDFETLGSFIDTGTGREGRILRSPDLLNGALELSLVPFLEHRLPSPQHIAFEVSSSRFDQHFKTATALGLKIRAKPPLNSQELGIGLLDAFGMRYENFYVLDPSGINVEVMRRIP